MAFRNSLFSSGFCSPHCSYIHLFSEYVLSSHYCQHSPLALLHLPGFNHMGMTWIFNCLLSIFQHVKGKVFFLKASVKVLVYGFDLCPFLNQLLWLEQRNVLIVLCLGQIH